MVQLWRATAWSEFQQTTCELSSQLYQTVMSHPPRRITNSDCRLAIRTCGGVCTNGRAQLAVGRCPRS
eukprot:8884860-Alexandrium_andersonii.AAC.1